MTKEIWRDIEGYEGLYQVSDQGRVKSLKRKGRRKERILKLFYSGAGYLNVCLSDGIGGQKWYYIHRLVGETFLPKPEGNDDINHKDEDKTNNNTWNLEWVSRKENCNFGTRNERIAKANSKPVAQYAKNGTFIKAWPSAAEVKRQLGFDKSSITQVANGKRKTANGYVWKYI